MYTHNMQAYMSIPIVDNLSNDKYSNYFPLERAHLAISTIFIKYYYRKIMFTVKLGHQTVSLQMKTLTG